MGAAVPPSAAARRGPAPPDGDDRSATLPQRRDGVYHPPDCGSRLPPPRPQARLTRHARPVEPMAHAMGAGSTRPDADQGATDSDRNPQPIEDDRAGHRPARSVPTCRPPSCTRTRSAPARASSPPTARSSSGPASTPVGAPRTSSSSTSPRAATRSGGARSTARSARPTTTDCAPGSSTTSRDRVLYAQDCFIGAAPEHRRSLRVYTETAWASIFARNLFRRPTAGGARRLRARTSRSSTFRSFKADPATEGTRTETAILVHLQRMEILIVGTEYAGEIKKSAFTVMNYLMPDEGVLPMHSAVNVGPAGDSVVFFGLSGTGKTTLSADPLRSLIGDDEHGWGDAGVFNFEGGCYAKTIRLSPMYEPDIFQTTQPVRDDPRERRPRPADPRARPRFRPVHREHPGRLSARLHRQCRPDRDRRPAPARGPPDGRRVRGPAADQPG